MARVGCIVLIYCLSQLTAFAQEIKVTSGFIKDSVAIGEPVSYYLTVRYPQSITTLFPDSTFAFTPFEFGKKTFFPTKTTTGISYDSAVYTLSTFEIDKIQYLSLPVFVTTARDCTRFESLADSIHLIEQIKIPASDTTTLKTLELKSNTLYERVFTQLNTIILMIILGVMLIAAIITWIFFGKKIVRHFKIKKLQKSHLKFIAEFDGKVRELTVTFSREKTEQTVLLWKLYLEQLERKPYTKLTTKEVSKMEGDSVMSNSLGLIDNAIYGNQTSVSEPLYTLKKIAEERFTKKLQQISHG